MLTWVSLSLILIYTYIISKYIAKLIYWKVKATFNLEQIEYPFLLSILLFSFLRVKQAGDGNKTHGFSTPRVFSSWVPMLPPPPVDLDIALSPPPTLSPTAGTNPSHHIPLDRWLCHWHHSTDLSHRMVSDAPLLLPIIFSTATTFTLVTPSNLRPKTMGTPFLSETLNHNPQSHLTLTLTSLLS